MANSSFVYVLISHRVIEEINGLRIISYDFKTEEWKQLKYLKNLKPVECKFSIHQDKFYKKYGPVNNSMVLKSL